VAKRHKKTYKRSTSLSGIWLWVTVGVVVLAALYMLARTLATSTQEAPPLPFLTLAREDLGVKMRMLGDVAVPAGQDPALAAVDSLIALQSWQDAAARIRRLTKSKKQQTPALRMRLGLCLYKVTSLDRSLAEFRRALADPAADSEALARAEFNSAFLFQSRGYADSSVVHYARARRLIADSLDPLLPAVLNNTGVAYDALKDTAAARQSLLSAAAYIDTAADRTESQVLRDNLRSVGR